MALLCCLFSSMLRCSAEDTRVATRKMQRISTQPTDLACAEENPSLRAVLVENTCHPQCDPRLDAVESAAPYLSAQCNAVRT